jgi:hypothetical protein
VPFPPPLHVRVCHLHAGGGVAGLWPPRYRPPPQDSWEGNDDVGVWLAPQAATRLGGSAILCVYIYVRQIITQGLGGLAVIPLFILGEGGGLWRR